MRYLEDVARRVAHDCPPIPIRSCKRRLAFTGLPNQQYAIADANFGGAIRVNITGGSEHRSQECSLARYIIDNHPGRNRVESGRKHHMFGHARYLTYGTPSAAFLRIG
jgi:hypothetical protein